AAHRLLRQVFRAHAHLAQFAPPYPAWAALQLGSKARRLLHRARAKHLRRPQDETLVPRRPECAGRLPWALAGYCFVLLGGGSGGSQAESSGPEANASIRAAITKSDSCNPPIFRVVNDTSQKPHPNASSG